MTSLKTYESKVLNIENLESQYLLIRASRPNNLSFFSGQYASIEIHDNIGTCEFLYSIASSNFENDFIEFCIQITTASRASSFWKNLKIGDLLRINNLGGSELITDYSKPVVMLAGGSGIAPFRAMIHDLFKYKKLLGNENITLIYGVKKSSAMPYKEEFLKFKNQFKDNLKVNLYTEQDNNNEVSKGNLVTAIEKQKNNFDVNSNFYICGSLNMIQTVKDKLLESKIAARQIFHEY